MTELLRVFFARGDEIEPCRFHARVAKNVGETGDVAVDPIKRASKEVPKVMREYLR